MSSRLAGMGHPAGRATREVKEEVKAPTGIDAATTTRTGDLAQPVDAEMVLPEPATDGR